MRNTKQQHKTVTAQLTADGVCLAVTTLFEARMHLQHPSLSPLGLSIALLNPKTVRTADRGLLTDTHLQDGNRHCDLVC